MSSRLKLIRGLGDFVPLVINFSALEKELEENEIDYQPSDDGLEQKRMENNVEYEELVVQILCNLEPREKTVFVYQLLRDGGFQIDHSAFAKSLGLSRSQYMKVLSTVRTKSLLYMYAYKQRFHPEGHKQG